MPASPTPPKPPRHDKWKDADASAVAVYALDPAVAGVIDGSRGRTASNGRAVRRAATRPRPSTARRASTRAPPRQVRWVREAKGSPVAGLLTDSGVPHADASEAPNAVHVFGLPVEVPAGATLRGDMTAVEQFDNWLERKQGWAEHSVSATIYADDREWMALGAEEYRNPDRVTGPAFLPRDDGVYKYAPDEELSEEKYDEVLGKPPGLNRAELTECESEDTAESGQLLARLGGKCG